MTFLDRFLGTNTDTDDTDPGPEPEPAVEMDIEEALELLSNQRRRTIVQVLARAGHELPKRDLVDHVAAREYRTHPRRLEGQQRKRVHVALHQTHLPMLDNADVITFSATGIDPHDEIHVLADTINQAKTTLTTRGDA